MFSLKLCKFNNLGKMRFVNTIEMFISTKPLLSTVCLVQPITIIGEIRVKFLTMYIEQVSINVRSVKS